jgi:hypothetical protein
LLISTTQNARIAFSQVWTGFLWAFWASAKCGSEAILGVRAPQQLDEMVKTMDAVGVERTVIFTGASNPETFAIIRARW